MLFLIPGICCFRWPMCHEQLYKLGFIINICCFFCFVTSVIRAIPEVILSSEMTYTVSSGTLNPTVTDGRRQVFLSHQTYTP